MVKHLLVIANSSTSTNWVSIFENSLLHYSNGTTEELRVDQAAWEEISITSYDTGPLIELTRSRNPIPNTKQNEYRVFPVDFILLRSVTRGLFTHDARNTLFGLMHAGIPAINSLESAYMCLERPIVMGALKAIRKKLGTPNFPLIEQTHFPSTQSINQQTEYPCVIKVGHAHAGYGKMKINDQQELDGIKDATQIHQDVYVSVEPFIRTEFDIRLQKIGCHFRKFVRRSANWKGNVGTSILQEVEVTDYDRRLAEECGKAFGGMEILALDLLHSQDNQELVLELNDTAIGLAPTRQKEDEKHIRDLVIERMQIHFEALVAQPQETSISQLEEQIAQIKSQIEEERLMNLKKLEPPKQTESKSLFSLF